MTTPPDPNEDEFCDGNEPPCPNDCEEGMILRCPDDMCRAIGDCIHGDGWVPCDKCDRP